MVKAVRANQWVIHDQDLTEDELNGYPQIIFRSAAKCLFDYFHLVTRTKKLQDIVDYSPQAELVFEHIRRNQPCVIVCPHLSNFDLMGYAGISITPMGLSAFRQARHRLRDGGSILTGLDRPMPNQKLDKYRPVFFGYETNLPVTYVRMAIEANAPIFIMAATSQPGGRYCLQSSGALWMEHADDLETEILANANRVLKEAEGLIRKYADQWAMFYPIWPQFLDV